MLGEENIYSKKLWLSVSQAAKLFGVEQKTIRRAIKAKQVDYVVEENRYNIDMGSLIKWAHQSARLKNKLDQEGMGKFIKEWKEEFKNS
ncbi:MAG: hypothetical protein WC323_03980 [Patescibacteria group bacterium]|jgi:hypothetical protein